MRHHGSEKLTRSDFGLMAPPRSAAYETQTDYSDDQVRRCSSRLATERSTVSRARSAAALAVMTISRATACNSRACSMVWRMLVVPVFAVMSRPSALVRAQTRSRREGRSGKRLQRTRNRTRCRTEPLRPKLRRRIHYDGILLIDRV